MDMSDVYRQLNAKFGLASSANLARVWKILCTDDEAMAANMLPGTVVEISGKTGTPAGTIQGVLDSLFHKGVAFKSQRDGAVQYRLAKNIVQFHDACLLWEGATEEFFEAWKRIMDDDFTAMMKGLPESVQLPSFMRVIPVHEAIEPRTEVLTYEECARLIEESSQVAVVRCPCRLSQGHCAAPIESCIQLNRGAEYALDRGHGRALTKEEAMSIIRAAEEAGLVHMTENRMKGNAICNCCSCCCEMFRLMKNSGKKWILSPSRYRASVGEACNACGACVEVCPVDAISVEGNAVVEHDTCMGCGLCATVCPVTAITLTPVRSEDFIPK